MQPSWVLRAVLAALVCGLAATAALVAPSHAGSAAPTGNAVGTVETRLTVDGFSAVGSTIVGHGTATTILRQVNGKTTVKRTPVRLKVRSAKRGPQGVQQTVTCQVLFLELDELDLTLLGLRVFLRSAVPDHPIRLRLHARREGGILGRLFCNLAESTPTTTTAKKAAKQLNARMSGARVMQAKLTLFAPRSVGSAGSTPSSVLPAQELQCPVAHLILGPLHLDLLGLIVDLSKIELDIWGIPGTTIGDLFCQLAPPSGSGA